MSTAAVITTVAGRHRHLIMQRAGLLAGQRVPDVHVIVAMDDLGVAEAARRAALNTVVEHVPVRQGRLPLARARNLGASSAIAHGADVLIFLDVDCIPGPRLVTRYLHTAPLVDRPLLCGPVGYLPAPPPEGYRLAELARQAVPHHLRPVPPEQGLVAEEDVNLFWGLSFATSTECWVNLGGFCELYEGYGAEDTDFAHRAARSGVSLTWVGGAWAYHQHHSSQEPPTQHLHDILRNAAIFRRRWGWWPMQGWLAQFLALGLAAYDSASDHWFPTAAAHAQMPRVQPPAEPQSAPPHCYGGRT